MDSGNTFGDGDPAAPGGQRRSYARVAYAARLLRQQARVAAAFGQGRQAVLFDAAARDYAREAARLRLAARHAAAG